MKEVYSCMSTMKSNAVFPNYITQRELIQDD